MTIFLTLIASCMLLSVTAFGGANAVVPEMHRLAVEVQGWMTNAEFSQYFALATASPGPNAMLLSLIGWHVAGVAGGITAMVSFCLPTSILGIMADGALRRHLSAALQARLKRALGPLAVGMTASGAILVARGLDPGWREVLLVAAVAAGALLTRLHPLLLLAVGAACGALGLVGK